MQEDNFEPIRVETHVTEDPSRKLHPFLGKPRTEEVKRAVAEGQHRRWAKVKAEKAAKEALEKQFNASSTEPSIEPVINKKEEIIPEIKPNIPEIKLNDVNIFDLIENEDKEIKTIKKLLNINNIKIINRNTVGITSYTHGTYLTDLAKRMVRK